MNNIRLVSVMLGACLLASSAHGAKKFYPPETATVVSQDISSTLGGIYAAPIGRATVARTLYNSSNVVVVDTGEYRYQWVESGKHFIVLPVNGKINFYRDGKWFVVLDATGKKHRFGLIGQAVRGK